MAAFNPNTRTIPLFRTRCDADLARTMYAAVPIFVDERSGGNPWQARLLRMFDMSADSDLFSERETPEMLPLYESKMMAAYDHRFASVDFRPANRFRPGQPRLTSPQEHADPFFRPRSHWYVRADHVQAVFGGAAPRWLIAFKRIVGTTNERTLSAVVLPLVAVSDSLAEIFSVQPAELVACLLANLNSLVLDTLVRMKVGATTLSHFVVKQLPILTPHSYTRQDLDFVVPRVLELTYTASDLAPFAADLGFTGDPFPWDEDRRALLRSELDAYFARRYGLTRKQLRYLLDPADLTRRELEDLLDPWEEVSDPLDRLGYLERAAASRFPGETFRVLKKKELKRWGEYRTRRLVLEAWERGVGDDSSVSGANKIQL